MNQDPDNLSMSGDKNTLAKIALDYALSKADEAVLASLLNEELSREEKASALMKLSDERIRPLLLKLGFNPEFLKTI